MTEDQIKTLQKIRDTSIEMLHLIDKISDLIIDISASEPKLEEAPNTLLIEVAKEISQSLDHVIIAQDTIDCIERIGLGLVN